MMQAALPADAMRADEGHVCIERLSERVLLAYWRGTGRCNLTAIQSEKGLVIIDTEMSPRIMAPIKKRIEQEFGRSDWAYVINTHGHMHHAGGNVLFKPAVVVGHENLPEDMEWLIKHQTDAAAKRQVLANASRTIRNLRAVLNQVANSPQDAQRLRSEIAFWQLYGQDMREGFEVVRPSLMFADRHTLDLGDLRLELVFFGKGHSLSDILIYVPQERLLVTGPIVYQRNHLPEIGEASTMKDVHRYMAVLDAFLADNVRIDHVVPSHSPPLLKSDLTCVREYYHRLLAGLRAARREGRTLEQATELLSLSRAFPTYLVPQPGQWNYGMQERNIKNLWRILDEESPQTN